MTWPFKLIHFQNFHKIYCRNVTKLPLIKSKLKLVIQNKILQNFYFWLQSLRWSPMRQVPKSLELAKLKVIWQLLATEKNSCKQTSSSIIPSIPMEKSYELVLHQLSSMSMLWLFHSNEVLQKHPKHSTHLHRIPTCSPFKSSYEI